MPSLLSPVGQLDEVTPRTNRADGQTDALQSSSKAQDMDVECVAPGRPLRPAALREGVPADDRPYAIEQNLGDASLDGWEGNPCSTVSQDAILQLQLEADVLIGTHRKGTGSKLQVDVVDRHAHPILEAVGRLGRNASRLDQEETRQLLDSETFEAGALGWPAEQDDIH